MSTRSRIAIENEDGTYESIYCHSDGYPDGVGKKLKSEYTRVTKIRGLIALGDISYLGDVLGTKQNFDKPNYQWTLAYHRDIGEEWKDVKPKKHQHYNDLLGYTRTTDAEYLYVFEDGNWKVIDLWEICGKE